MRKRTRLYLVLLALILIGCQRTETETDTPTNTPQIVQTDTPPTPLDIVVSGNTQFAFDLYHALGDDRENVIFSPYSISTALAMVYAGARENTELQIAETLHFDLPQTELHPLFATLDEQLTALASDSENAFQLNVANAVWAQDGYPLQPDYVSLLDEHYGAGVQVVNIVDAPEDARVTINEWVSEQTNERIPELLPPGSLTPMSRLVLTNAIYFNAAWSVPFDEAETNEEEFTLLDGGDVQVPMMHTSQGLFIGYIERDNFQAIELNYEPDRQVTMMIILPDSGAFGDVEALLDAEWFRQIREELQKNFSAVEVSMPRFGMDTAVELTEMLSEMGMPDAFQSRLADFSGITDSATSEEGFFIGKVIHQANIDVDEAGTEAAAATAATLFFGMESLNIQIEFRVERPFIYIIYHHETGTVLFLGRVLNPLER